MQIPVNVHLQFLLEVFKVKWVVVAKPQNPCSSLIPPSHSAATAIRISLLQKHGSNKESMEDHSKTPPRNHPQQPRSTPPCPSTPPPSRPQRRRKNHPHSPTFTRRLEQRPSPHRLRRLRRIHQTPPHSLGLLVQLPAARSLRLPE